MSMVRYFFLSLNVLNGLLAVAVAAVVFFAVIPFLNPAAISLPLAKGTVAGSGEQAAPSQRSFPADYAVIGEQNLFHPERKIPPEKKQEKEKEKVIPKPELFLYGTLILDDTSFAFVEDKKAPYSTEGRGKRQRTLKKGESLGGYILSEVEVNRIVLVKGEDKLVVMLDDKAKRRGEGSSSQMGAGKAAGGMTPVAPSSPQAAPASARAVTPPAPGPAPRIGDPGILDPRLTRHPQTMPASGQTGPSSPASGIGSSGTWPPTKSSIEQTRQKIDEGRQMRAGQMQK